MTDCFVCQNRLQWKGEGLPADQLSVENAIVISSAVSSTPYIIDPSTQAVSWLQAHMTAGEKSPFTCPHCVSFVGLF